MSMLGNTVAHPKPMGIFSNLALDDENKESEERNRSNQFFHLGGKRSNLGAYPGLALRLTG